MRANGSSLGSDVEVHVDVVEVEVVRVVGVVVVVVDKRS